MTTISKKLWEQTDELLINEDKTDFVYNIFLHPNSVTAQFEERIPDFVTRFLRELPTVR